MTTTLHAAAGTTRADARWMRRALTVAEASRDLTRPNPFVGAVVVADGVEVAAASTAPAGGPHAEVLALAAAGEHARGATVYVTLEPCAHHGRTPPCTDALLGAGVARVVHGLAEPNPVAGGGAAVLAAAGVDVTGGVLADRVAAQLEVFVTAVTQDRPHVTLKLAQTVAGETRPGALDRRWITGTYARRRVHELRAEVDGIMVGSQTAMVDDPQLTVRDAPPPRTAPRAIVADRRGRLPVDLRLVRPGTIVLTSPDAEPQWRRALARRGTRTVVAADLAEAMAALVELEVTAVLAEPGPTLAGALLAAGMVDRLLVHVADSAVTDPDLPAFGVDVHGLSVVARRRLGPDVEWELRPVGRGPDAGFAPGQDTATPPATRPGGH